MSYIVKIGKEINISNVNEILNLVGWGEYTPEQWKIVIDKSTFMVEVLHQNQTIGFARVVDDTRMCMIYDVCVHPDYQKQGVGTLLMKEILKYVEANDFSVVNLFYDRDNKGLDNFYRKFGFESIPNAMRLMKR